MSYVIAVAKQGKDAVTDTSPNDFIFNSDYNTFKIIRSGVKTCVIPASSSNQLFTEPHFLSFTPLVTAMAKHVGYNQAFPPNSKNIYLYSAKAGLFSSGITFRTIAANATNILFRFDNSKTGPHDSL